MNAVVLRTIAILVSAALALAATAAPAPAAATRARCAVKHSKTVAKNRQVRLYVTRDREGNRVLHGCWRANGRKLRAAAEYDDDYVTSGVYRDVLLAGRFVAFVFEATDISCKAACPPDYDATRVQVTLRDVRTRRSRFVLSDAAPRSLRLSNAGVAAWLSPVAGGAELRVIDGAGRGRLLDTGAIDAASVLLRGLRLDWMTAGAPKSADLTPF